VAHPTEAELRQLGNEILDLLVRKTVEEAESLQLARENQIRRDYGAPLEELPRDEWPPMQSGEEMVAEVEAYVRDAYSFLPDTFAKFAEPRPENFNPAIEQCARTLMMLQPTLERVTGLGELLGAASSATDVAADFPTTVAERVSAVNSQVASWSGTAADAFHLHYMNEFPQSLQHQHEAVFGLAAAMEANKKIFENVGQDILVVGQKTKDALNHVTDKNPTGEIIFFTVVAAVATVGATATGVGTAAVPAIAVAFATVAAGGSAAAGIIGATADDPFEAEIEGATTQEIMVSMVDRISDLYRYIDEQEQKIVAGLNGSIEYLEQLRNEIELPLPDSYMDLGDAPPDEIRDDFLHT
jgi:hypothetical protein